MVLTLSAFAPLTPLIGTVSLRVALSLLPQMKNSSGQLFNTGTILSVWLSNNQQVSTIAQYCIRHCHNVHQEKTNFSTVQTRIEAVSMISGEVLHPETWECQRNVDSVYLLMHLDRILSHYYAMSNQTACGYISVCVLGSTISSIITDLIRFTALIVMRNGMRLNRWPHEQIPPSIGEIVHRRRPLL